MPLPRKIYFLLAFSFATWSSARAAGDADDAASQLKAAINNGPPKDSAMCQQLLGTFQKAFDPLYKMAKDTSTCRRSLRTKDDGKLLTEDLPGYHIQANHPEALKSNCLYSHALAVTDIDAVREKLELTCAELAKIPHIADQKAAKENCYSAETAEERNACLKEICGDQACILIKTGEQQKKAAEMLKQVALQLKESARMESIAREANSNVVTKWATHLHRIDTTLRAAGNSPSTVTGQTDEQYFKSPKVIQDTLADLGISNAATGMPGDEVDPQARRLSRFSNWVSDYQDPKFSLDPDNKKLKTPNDPLKFSEYDKLGQTVQEQAQAIHVLQALREFAAPYATKVSQLSDQLHADGVQSVTSGKDMGNHPDEPVANAPDLKNTSPEATALQPTNREPDLTGGSRPSPYASTNDPTGPDRPHGEELPPPPASPFAPSFGQAPALADGTAPTPNPSAPDASPAESSGGSVDDRHPSGDPAPHSSISSREGAGAPTGSQEAAAKALAPEAAKAGEPDAKAPSGEGALLAVSETKIVTPRGAGDLVPANSVPTKPEEIPFPLRAVADRQEEKMEAAAAAPAKKAELAEATAAPGAEVKSGSLRAHLLHALMAGARAKSAKNAGVPDTRKPASQGAVDDDAVTGAAPAASEAAAENSPAFRMNASDTDAEVKRMLASAPEILGADSPALFERVHEAHQRSLKSGRTSVASNP